MKKKILYISYDSIEDSISKSQVLPLLKELSNHSKKLLKKPKTLFITKSDIMPPDMYGQIDKPKDINSVFISSINGYNLKDSIQEIKKILSL